MSNELGEFLENLRGKMSLRDAAQKSGLSHTYIRDLELGKNRKTKAPIRPSADTLKQLAKAYNHPSTDLLIKAGYLEANNQEMIGEKEIPKNPLITIKDFLQNKGENLEQFGFFNIDEWEDLTPDEVEEILEDFEMMFERAKKKKNK
jgi:transcriptional regulator with XRE-family HTH domain